MRKQRRKNTRSRRNKAQLETKKKLKTSQKKFIPTSVTKDNQIRQQLVRDFEQFARSPRMRLQYMYYGTKKEQHPF